MLELMGVANIKELQGKYFREFVNHEDDTVDGYFHSLDIQSKVNEIVEVTVNGNKICEVTAVVYQVPNGETTSILVVRDRTLKRQFEIQQAELKIKEAFISALEQQLRWIQHEVKNSVLAFDQLLEQFKALPLQELPPFVLDAFDPIFDQMRREVTQFKATLDKHVLLGQLASETYAVTFSKEFSADEIRQSLFRAVTNHDTIDLQSMRLDLNVLHHAASNLESNTHKYADSTRNIVKVAKVYTKSVPVPTDSDIVICQGVAMGERLLSGIEEGEMVHTMLHLSLSNYVLPDEYDKLKKMADVGTLSNLFDNGFRIAGEKCMSTSAGDGLALVQRVSEALMCTLWVALSVDHQITFSMNVPCLLPNYDPEARFNPHTLMAAIDDSKLMRSFYTKTLKKMNVPQKILGDSFSHYQEFPEVILKFIDEYTVQMNVQTHMVTMMIILDQNLDNDFLGTNLVKDLKSHLKSLFEGREETMPRVITCICSANTSAEDVRLYMECADGVIPKGDNWKTIKQIMLSIDSSQSIEVECVKAVECTVKVNQEIIGKYEIQIEKIQMSLCCSAEEASDIFKTGRIDVMEHVALCNNILEITVWDISHIVDMAREWHSMKSTACMLCMAQVLEETTRITTMLKAITEDNLSSNVKDTVQMSLHIVSKLMDANDSVGCGGM